MVSCFKVRFQPISMLCKFAKTNYTDLLYDLMILCMKYFIVFCRYMLILNLMQYLKGLFVHSNGARFSKCLILLCAYF